MHVSTLSDLREVILIHLLGHAHGVVGHAEPLVGGRLVGSPSEQIRNRSVEVRNASAGATRLALQRTAVPGYPICQRRYTASVQRYGGSVRYNLDEWLGAGVGIDRLYWKGPRFSASLPIKRKIVNDPVDDVT